VKNLSVVDLDDETSKASAELAEEAAYVFRRSETDVLAVEALGEGEVEQIVERAYRLRATRASLIAMRQYMVELGILHEEIDNDAIK
jgi:hypothetical protein